ncbi:gas vesicle protein [Streptomyces sp. p1417]|uniref:Gas vesicle protein n=1 Tax=Streptomyces typhae TaxID=2681492 RepID=A0A6L6X0H0_9ACTN|nr:gas vesicle protein [Streptomyces typhae]MVO87252.1 gas vesicle protein [Streptomyces typhae]
MSGAGDPFAQREIALVDLLDRLLAGGVVLAGDITLRIADVDLVRIDLKALISSVNAQVPAPWPEGLEGLGGLEGLERPEREAS